MPRRRVRLRQDARCSTSSPASTARPPATVDVVGRTALMFQESALFPWLTVADNVDLPLKLRKVPRAPSATDRVGELLDARAPRRLRPTAPARAVGRDAPARRPGPGAGAGRRRAAHGRAVRRPRRDDPRRPPRRARAHLAADRRDGRVRHPQRARGGPPRRPRRAAVQPARAASRPSSTSPFPSARGGSRTPPSATLAAEVTDRLREEVARHGHDH